MFSSVQFERRNGLPVFVQPRHVAAFEPYITDGEQGVQTTLTLATGDKYVLVEPPSVVQKRLQAGA